MGLHYDGLDNHEGYATRRLPDGTLTATWTADTAAFDGYQAACDCGWNGTTLHPPTDAEAARDEWDADHAQALLAAVVPAAVREALDRLAAELRTDAGDQQLLDARPAAAAEVARRLRAWADAIEPPATIPTRQSEVGRGVLR